MSLRTCTICNEAKTVDCFYKHTPYRNRPQKRNQCIPCVRARNLANYYRQKLNPDKVKLPD